MLGHVFGILAFRFVVANQLIHLSFGESFAAPLKKENPSLGRICFCIVFTLLMVFMLGQVSPVWHFDLYV